MRSKRLFLAALAGLGIATSVNAAPIVTTTLVLRDVTGTSGVLLAPTSTVSGVAHYALPAGWYRVELQAAVTSPNQTDGGHTDSDSQPLLPISLGIQNLVGDIRASGHSVVSARSTAGSLSSPGVWARDSTGTTAASKLNASFGFAQTNLLDDDSDGDLEPVGAGYANNSAPWSYDGTSGNGPGSALALQSGLSGATGVVRGAFFYDGSGTSTLQTAIAALNMFAEDPADSGANANNNIIAVDGLQPANATIVNTPIVLDAVPEPASLGLLGLAGVGLLGRRRKA